MTIYNFNLGIGWANSGVEYAQSYRAKLLRELGQEAKFIFTDLILSENIEHLTANLGLKDEEVIWLYSYFTDVKISPTTYTLADLKASLGQEVVKEVRNGKAVYLYLAPKNGWVAAYLKNSQSDLVERAEFVSNNCLYRKDYYTYTRLFSEYYTPRDNRAYVYQRRFFNEDGSVAYEEIMDGDSPQMFRFLDKILYSKAEFIDYFVSKLAFKAGDILLLDRSKGLGQQVFRNKGEAKLGVMVHADHFSEHSVDDDYILWNDYYDYQFTNSEAVDFFVVATASQRDLLLKQFAKYEHKQPKVVVIPVGSVDKLRHPKVPRQPFALITASRLAPEKHVDWLVNACIRAHKEIPDLTLDIYGEGSGKEQLEKLIVNNQAQKYIRLKGHQDLKEQYVNYSAYITASTTEGFGLSLLEAIASGLPLIGLDVRYGMQTFVDNGQNGYVCPWSDSMGAPRIVDNLAFAITELFKADLSKFREHSYHKAQPFMEANVRKAWAELIATEGGLGHA